MTPIVIAYNANVRKLTESVIFYDWTVAKLADMMCDANVPSKAMIDTFSLQPDVSTSIFDDPPASTLQDVYEKDDYDDMYERVAHLRTDQASTTQVTPTLPLTLHSHPQYSISAETVNQLHSLKAVIDSKKKVRAYQRNTIHR